MAKQANSFEVIGREWYAKHSANWSANHGDRIIRRLERDIFPWIGGSPVADITAPQLLEVNRRIEQRGVLETAHRALGHCGQSATRLATCEVRCRQSKALTLPP